MEDRLTRLISGRPWWPTPLLGQSGGRAVGDSLTRNLSTAALVVGASYTTYLVVTGVNRLGNYLQDEVRDAVHGAKLLQELDQGDDGLLDEAIADLIPVRAETQYVSTPRGVQEVTVTPVATPSPSRRRTQTIGCVAIPQPEDDPLCDNPPNPYRDLGFMFEKSEPKLLGGAPEVSVEEAIRDVVASLRKMEFELSDSHSGAASSPSLEMGGSVANTPPAELGLATGSRIGPIHCAKEHMRKRSRLRTLLGYRVRCRFGMPLDTAANRMVVRRYVNDLLRGKNMREKDLARTSDEVVELVFVPDEDQINLQGAMNSAPMLARKDWRRRTSWADWWASFRLGNRPPKRASETA